MLCIFSVRLAVYKWWWLFCHLCICFLKYWKQKIVTWCHWLRLNYEDANHVPPSLAFCETNQFHVLYSESESILANLHASCRRRTLVLVSVCTKYILNLLSTKSWLMGSYCLFYYCESWLLLTVLVAQSWKLYFQLFNLSVQLDDLHINLHKLQVRHCHQTCMLCSFILHQNFAWNCNKSEAGLIPPTP